MLRLLHFLFQLLTIFKVDQSANDQSNNFSETPLTTFPSLFLLFFLIFLKSLPQQYFVKASSEKN